MIVLYITTYSGLPGGNKSLLGILDEIKRAELDIEPYVILITGGPIAEELKIRGIPFYIVPGKRWIASLKTIEKYPRKIINILIDLFNLVMEIKLHRIIKKICPDVIHINTMASGFGIRAANKLGIPVIVHARDFITEDHKKNFWDPEMAYRRLGNSNKIVCVSNEVKKKFSPLINTELITIYNGINLSLYPKNRKDYEHENTEISIVGRIFPGKGQKDAILAVNSLVKRGYCNLHLNIVGAPSSIEYLTELKKLVDSYSLNHYITFWGYRDDIADFWQNSDIALICSSQEAFGRVTIEAQAGYAFVIGANTGGTKEIVTNMETGLLYKEGDFVDLASKIEWYINNPNEARRIKIKARRNVENYFTIEKTVKNLLALYLNLLKNK